jgi:Autotransporter beta-domain
MIRAHPFLVILVVAAACYGSFRAPAAFADESAVYLAVDSFTWKEFASDGSRLLKESGTLYGAGFIYQKEFENHVAVRPVVELFGGKVDYDGRACDLTGSCQPAMSDVDYFGIKLEGDVGRIFRPEESFSIEPFGGLGLRVWTRGINNGTAANGSATSGYKEDWAAFYARLGLRAGADLSSKTRLFAEAGAKLPLYNENTARVSDIGLGPDVTLHPGKQASFFAEAGITVKRFTASVFYDGLRFSQSSTVINGFIAAYQPRSTADIYGVKLGVVF